MKRLIRFLIFVIASVLLILGINYFCFPKNNVDESRVNAYINNSFEMELDVPKDTSVTVEMKTIYTGIGTAFSRGKMAKYRYSELFFYNTKYQKYFVLVLDYAKIYGYSTSALGQITKVRVNKEDFESSSYGTKDNPVPIFFLDVPKYRGHPDYEEIKITDNQYRNIVYHYLTYMMSKKEFKERFEKE